MIYDQAKNLDFYRSLGIGDRYAKAVDFLKNTDLASLADGEYMIFAPWDGHKPKACNGVPSEVKKIVIKIREK